MTTDDIETIEAMKRSRLKDEALKHDDPDTTEEFDTEDEENEFYLSILYQMCVAA